MSPHAVDAEELIPMMAYAHDDDLEKATKLKSGLPDARDPASNVSPGASEAAGCSCQSQRTAGRNAKTGNSSMALVPFWIVAIFINVAIYFAGISISRSEFGHPYPWVRLLSFSACCFSFLSVWYLGPIAFVYHYFHFTLEDQRAPSLKMPLVMTATAGLSIALDFIAYAYVFGLVGPDLSAHAFIPTPPSFTVSLYAVGLLLSLQYSQFVFRLMMDWKRLRAGSG